MCLYGIAVACFFVAGALDLRSGSYKEGVIAMIFGLANALIFFWRP
jgi:hypothetical protein